MISRRDTLMLGAAWCAAATVETSAARAQAQYPDRPIRLVVPFAPGGVNDVAARLWAERVKSSLGTIVIENQGGAGGSLGATTVARAAPDGYTLLLGGAGSQVLNPLMGQVHYDPIRDFEPISIIAVTALAIAVNPGLPIRSLAELIAYVKANRGNMSYGSAGTGSMTHLAAELFKSLIDTPELVHVPYRGAGPSMADVVSGHVPLVMPNVTSQVLDLHASGKLRLIAVTAPKRLAAAPDIPTAQEAGLDGMIAQNFVGLFAPAKTATEITGHVAAATRLAMADAEFRRLLIASGFEPIPDSGPEQARRFVEEDIARWAPVVKKVGLKLG
jgi:tripartite-type tricarboxylate transporter receptor subunit TctC